MSHPLQETITNYSLLLLLLLLSLPRRLALAAEFGNGVLQQGSVLHAAPHLGLSAGCRSAPAWIWPQRQK
jgi:hypothetical protein